MPPDRTSAPRITYVGHATVLIEIDGLRILTDPVLRSRVSHLVRQVASPHPDLLADIDLVLVSHGHHDHLHGPSLRGLRGAPRAVVPPGARGVASRAGLEVEVLTSGESARVGAVTIEAVHADHEGSRWGKVGDQTALGFVVRSDAASVYFAGDTGLFDEMADLNGIDIGLIPVAGWGPKLGPGHLGPREAAQAVAMIEPAVAIPIHWGTLARIAMKTDGPRDRPAREFAEHVAKLAPDVRVEVLQPGESLG